MCPFKWTKNVAFRRLTPNLLKSRIIGHFLTGGVRMAIYRNPVSAGASLGRLRFVSM